MKDTGRATNPQLPLTGHGYVGVVAESTTAEWLADYDRATVERERREKDERRAAFKYLDLPRRLLLSPVSLNAVHRVLCDHAHVRSGRCFLKVATIAAEAGCEVTTARRALRKLESMGLLETKAGTKPNTAGRPGANVYRVLIPEGDLK